MDDLSAADVESYMIDASAGGIKEEVAGLEAVKAHRGSARSLGGRGSGKSDAEVGKDGLNKTGTVSAVGQAGAAINIGIAHELYRIGSDLLTKI